MPEAVWGLTIGCFVSNIIGSTFIDAVFGTLATFVAALATSKIRKLWIAPLPAVIANGLIVGACVTLISVPFTIEAYTLIALSIAISEFIICYAGGIPLLVFMNELSKKIKFFR
jgi:uncharacterized membrane protein